MIISSPVFKNITPEDFDEFKNMHALYNRSFRRGETILHSGERTETIGIVQKGSILIENIDPWGNRSILNETGEGSVFAESYALSGEPMMVDAVSNVDSIIIFINIKRLLDTKNSSRGWYVKLLNNLISVTAAKNMVLSNRIFCTTPKTIRARILMYLSGVYRKNNRRAITIPFNREQMASYLNVDRTALSKELGRMKRDGLIDWHKNSFTLMTPDPAYADDRESEWR